jgi:hypothetical protein
MENLPPIPERRRFPIARAALGLARRGLRNWRERHQLSVNFWLHMVGIPLAVFGLVLLPFLSWYWGAAAVIVGYGLQYLGHRVEGNDLGEWAAVKRLLGLPYVGVAPRWRRSDPQSPALPG